MLIAQQKRKENIAEYLLYMWQVEDIIRAFNFDMDVLKANVINRYEVDEEMRLAIGTWYSDLMDMMRLEGVKESGHLQINNNVLKDLEELSSFMLVDREELAYQQAFFKASQDLFLISQKSGISVEKPIALAFNATYGILTMKLKKQEISKETMESSVRIQKVLAILSHRFHNPKIQEEED